MRFSAQRLHRRRGGELIADLLRVVVTVALLAAGAVAAACSLYTLLGTLAAAVGRVLPPRQPPATRHAARAIVLVPAHDEALLIAGCVAALRAQDVDPGRYEVVVVADNCTDDTAGIARAAGARVLVRNDPTARGKGQALRFAIDLLLAEQRRFDVLLVVDADTVADPAFLSMMLGAYDSGAEAAQGESLLVADDASRSQLRAAAFLLVNRVGPAGRARMGLPCGLRGNGMLFAREVLEAHPWNAYGTTEDLEHSITLQLAGVRPRFVEGAILRTPTAPNAKAAELQSLRWEGGKVHIARSMVPALLGDALRHGRVSSLDRAIGLVIPPLALLAGASALGAVLSVVCAALGAVSWWTTVPWLVSLAAIVAHALLGLWAGRAPSSAYRALLHGPGLAVHKLVRVRSLFTQRSDVWVRTERADEHERPPDP